ncbi:hypothetical protein WN55_11157 [Dufourea novaeangliae]|uniref:Uncharacterized protein n=1 Tax=Dufourea novaeangliae TaxID=178035 RepID=A0A154PDF3_DUFNO|nr:hypothetical protein WN55_11157 [Dufourea novaeangliae]
MRNEAAIENYTCDNNNITRQEKHREENQGRVTSLDCFRSGEQKNQESLLRTPLFD